MKNVVISTSYKFEEVNLLLEVLKLNFKEPVKTHVFCNLNYDGWASWGDALDQSLIDMLVRAPDPACHPSNTSRDAKRRQPLMTFLCILNHFRSVREDFVFLEGDCFPLDEQKFLRPFERLESAGAFVNHFDFAKCDPNEFQDAIHKEVIEIARSQSHKMPQGYVYPGVMYVSWQTAEKLYDYINFNLPTLLDGTRNFEGCLGTAFKMSGASYETLSGVFAFAQPPANWQADPVSSVVHQDYVFDLKQSFVQKGITKGSWVQRVLTDTSFKHVANGTVVTGTGMSIVDGTLVIKADAILQNPRVESENDKV